MGSMAQIMKGEMAIVVIMLLYTIIITTTVIIIIIIVCIGTGVYRVIDIFNIVSQCIYEILYNA